MADPVGLEKQSVKSRQENKSREGRTVHLAGTGRKQGLPSKESEEVKGAAKSC